MLTYVFLSVLPCVLCELASYGTVPKGLNPTLYSSNDLVIQLDDTTFNDTVYCDGDKCTSYLVEFYSDWCGHCRSFAPLYKELAKDVRGWQEVVKIAAINCADSVNQVTCRTNNVQFFPFIKYFPRNSSDAFAGSKLRPYQSLGEMRDQLTKVVMDDYSINRFPDWPRFDYLGDFATWADLWEGAPPTTQHIAIIFENHQASLTGAQLLLDLHKKRDRMLVRRCLKNHPLADALRLTDFPSLAIFKREDKKPLLVVELRRLLLSELEAFLHGEKESSLLPKQFHSRKNRTDPCEGNPEKCRALFYVSEVDMLKAMRYALFRETSRTEAPLSGTNLTALHSFVSLLADHFPVSTTYGNSTLLDHSTRAVKVFARLRDFIENRGLESSIPSEEWQKEFIAAEEAAGKPFLGDAEWDHCRGSSGQFRGYTCGLWITFHALTVSSYKQAENHSVRALVSPIKMSITILLSHDLLPGLPFVFGKADPIADFKPLEPLQAIRAWVLSFFGCMHCRDHFQKMTTVTFPMESQVQSPDDVFMYLWRAHNIVNARLQGRDTEDPQFPKVQFPGKFLCSNCTVSGSLKDGPSRDFLLNYYSQIKPYQSPKFFFI